MKIKKTGKIVGAALIMGAMSVGAAILETGSGVVATGIGDGFGSRGAQAFLLRASDGVYTNDMEISITGTMTLSGHEPDDNANRVGVILTSSDTSDFPTNGRTENIKCSMQALTSTDSSGETEKVLLSLAGTKTVNNILLPVNSADTTVKFAINLTFPNNFNIGTNGGTFAYAYKIGFDYDNNGFYEWIDEGTLTTIEFDRIRLGFSATRAPSTTALAVTNTYAYTIHDSHVDILRFTSRPTTLGFVF